MDRTGPFVSVLVVFCVLFAPTVDAAVTVRINNVRFEDESGRELKFVPQDGLVRVVAVLRNSGDQLFNNGTVSLKFEFTKDTEYHRTQIVNRTVRIPSRNTSLVDVDYVWPGGDRVLGEQKVSVSIVGATGGNFSRAFSNATFTVSEHPVYAANFGERVLEYPWFFLSFLFVVVLALVALGARRP